MCNLYCPFCHQKVRNKEEYYCEHKCKGKEIYDKGHSKQLSPLNDHDRDRYDIDQQIIGDHSYRKLHIKFRCRHCEMEFHDHEEHYCHVDILECPDCEKHLKYEEVRSHLVIIHGRLSTSDVKLKKVGYHGMRKGFNLEGVDKWMKELEDSEGWSKHHTYTDRQYGSGKIFVDTNGRNTLDSLIKIKKQIMEHTNAAQKATAKKIARAQELERLIKNQRESILSIKIDQLKGVEQSYVPEMSQHRCSRVVGYLVSDAGARKIVSTMLEEAEKQLQRYEQEYEKL